MAIGHADITGTRAVELDKVGELGVVVVAAAVLGAEQTLLP